MWTDYQCPYCGRVERESLASLDLQYVQTGKVQVALRHHPLSELHSHAKKAAEAALCSGLQGRFWEMHQAIFLDQAHLEEPSLVERARKIGLSIPQFSNCLATGTTAGVVQADTDAAQALRLTSTPSFLIGARQADGRVKATVRLTGARPFDEFRKAIESIAKRAEAGRLTPSIFAFVRSDLGRDVSR
jgi:protein-disulfide isomerase